MELKNQQPQTEAVYFRLGKGLDDLLRQAYWFENHQEWALVTLDCLEGITQQQKMDVLNGDAQLLPTDDGHQLELVYKPDYQFKAKLQAHKKFLQSEKVFIGGKYVSADIFTTYMNNIKQMERWKERRGTDSDYRQDFNSRMITVLQRMNNDLYKIMFVEAGFRIMDNRKTLLEHQRVACEKFETALSCMTLAEVQKFREARLPIAEPRKTPLLEKDLLEGTTIYNDLLLLKEGEIPPQYLKDGVPEQDPNLTYEQAVLRIFDEAVEFVERFKDELHPDSLAHSFIQRKALGRRLIQEECSWSAIDTAEAAVHSIIRPQRHHGEHIWKNQL